MLLLWIFLAHSCNEPVISCFFVRTEICLKFFFTSLTAKRKVFVELLMSCFIMSLQVATFNNSDSFITYKAHWNRLRPIRQRKTILFSPFCQKSPVFTVHFSFFRIHIIVSMKRYFLLKLYEWKCNTSQKKWAGYAATSATDLLCVPLTRPHPRPRFRAYSLACFNKTHKQAVATQARRSKHAGRCEILPLIFS